MQTLSWCVCIVCACVYVCACISVGACVSKATMRVCICVQQHEMLLDTDSWTQIYGATLVHVHIVCIVFCITTMLYRSGDISV